MIRQFLSYFPSYSPYENPSYFILLGVALIPLVVQLLRGKRMMWYQNILTVYFLIISFGGPSLRSAFALCSYILWQTILVYIYFKYRQKRNNTGIFYGAVTLAILPLFLVKIIPFINSRTWFEPVVNNHPSLLSVPSFIGFLGISYLTFKAVQMVMEIRDGIITEYHIGRYLQFMLFFPTISSGPIDRYRRFESDLLNAPEKNEYVDMLSTGIHKIFMGFVYKFILAYLFGTILLPKMSHAAIADGGISWGLIGYMYIYTFYLFFDFAGYSLFAIGTSNIMGYNTPENFNKPFLAKNIKDFWDRWHISLSSWFRDYIYMRLMFTLLKKKVFKSRVVASNVGYFVLFLIMALWHGLTWFYLVYGLYHATLVCVTDWWLRFKRKHRKKLPKNKYTHAFAVVLTFHAVAFGLLLFSGFLDTLLFK
ncbi:D-alanyl-lipoteichoic acid biosynthesis protein DltB [Vagococcus coleopterorum]|uniref:Teichoic acid D-alanyltransferase n=1 Tax=Vagococcus coleopterorum TaxID=2714946 RepID=A0A6G8APX6_9ENTE|nr:D-alanyl-lipoteichoic acid biosynthesis protein DltB [Vagococcus coleopterorum]QIL46973.1 D-alanyl-lipoteichoic acid biosynthesis protein DltB [Vagococcus coleopterorum]